MDLQMEQQNPGGRRQALLDAAAELFFEQGYAATSIDAIIARAGGSKRNIYSEFGNKEGLFSSIVRQGADQILSALVIDEIEGRNLRETLTAFGVQLMNGYMSPALIGAYRTVVTEADRFPDLVRAFYADGPGRATARLAEVLEEARARGEIQVEDCERAAGHFVGMVRDNLHLQVVLGLRPPPTDQETRLIVASAVRLFLCGVQSGRSERI
jgi:AcrR family transcriptional regulator